uniref:Uncharacterized protein n=1 Tax=Monodelphis domestica TaxID=13616 RepID=A0A5F8GGM7_MONDO
MPVTGKDIKQQESVRALAAVLKKSGKQKIPEGVDMIKLAKHEALPFYDEDWIFSNAFGKSTKWNARQICL